MSERAAIPVATADEMPRFRGRTPAALAFGTSGLRGLVTDITDLEAYVNARGFLDFLLAGGGVTAGETVSIAGDLRPSSNSPDRSIMRAVARAIDDAKLRVDNLGRIPTPALAAFALSRGQPSIMVTGSHIPFDRNGIKFYKRSGEVLKTDEAGILASVAAVRRAEYRRPETASPFRDDGMFEPEAVRPLPPVDEAARDHYRRRAVEFFGPDALRGLRLVFFEHSAVGRDLLVEVLRALGAEVFPVGRSETFVALDTEDISAERLLDLQRMADEATRTHGRIDAVVSTDGDGDRPLLAGVTGDGRVQFIAGDLLGIVVAEALGAAATAVPISANDAVDLHFAGRGVEVRKTRIGSPHVIDAMAQLQARAKGPVVGWEANGGFLVGSGITRNGRTLDPLPTRDACLPLAAALSSCVEHRCSVADLFARLPRRFSKAGLIDGFPRERSLALVRRCSPAEPGVEEVRFDGSVPAGKEERMREELATCFTPDLGFGNIVRVNSLDGVRVWFDNGDIAHIRPSGNAPQLRIYAVADTQARADEIVAEGIREPDGSLRRLENRVAGW